MENVIEFPHQQKPEPLLFGPIEYFAVVHNGRIVPKLHGKRLADGSVNIIHERGFCAWFPDEETAQQCVYILANAMAVENGYSHFEAENKDHQYAGKMYVINSVGTEEP